MAAPVAATEPVKIYLMAGQSNMEGWGTWFESDDVTQNPNLVDPTDPFPLTQTDVDGYSPPLSQVWVSHPAGERATGPLVPGFGASSGNSGTIGIELSMGHQLAGANTNPFFFHKSDKGGTTLGGDWRPPSAVAARGGQVGPLYLNAIKQWHKLLSDLERTYGDYEGQGFEVAGFIWLQGWNDYGNAAFLAEYHDNVVDLAHDVRTDMGIPDLPVIISDCPSYPGVTAHEEMVLAKQQAVADLNAELPGSAAYVSSAGVGDSGEGGAYHWNFTASNYIEMGKRNATAAQSLMRAAPVDHDGSTAIAAAWAVYRDTYSQVVRYEMEELGGTVVDNTAGSGSVADAEITDSAARVLTPLGPGSTKSINANTGIIRATHDLGNLGNTHTIGAWIQLDASLPDAAGRYAILSGEDSPSTGTNSGFDFGVQRLQIGGVWENTLYVETPKFNGNATNDSLSRSDLLLQEGQPYFVAYVRNHDVTPAGDAESADNTMFYLYDPVSETVFANDGGSGSRQAVLSLINTRVGIGFTADNLSEDPATGFHGLIDDAQVWDVALSADEILTLAQTGQLSSGASGPLGTPSVTATFDDGASVECELIEAPADVTLVWAHSDQGESSLGAWTGASGGGSHVFGATGAAGVLSHTIMGLAGDTGFVCRFLATTTEGDVWSSPVGFPTGLGSSPAPTGLTVVSATAFAVELSWVGSYSTESNFVLRRASDAGFTSDVVDLFPPADATGYVDSTVVDGATYFYKVAPQNGAGIGVFSGSVSAVTPVTTIVTSVVEGGLWFDTTTWDTNSLPGAGDTAVLNHKVRIDLNEGVNGDEVTEADVVINAGGDLSADRSRATVADLTLNGGTVSAAQRTHQLVADNITINDVPGNLWVQNKTQSSKPANMTANTMSGSGDLRVESANRDGGDQYFAIHIPDMTGYTGTIVFDHKAGQINTTIATQLNTLRFSNSIPKADASFDVVLTKTDHTGGTYYHGISMTDGSVELWLTGLTIGGFEVPARETAYTYAELAAMDGGAVANYLKTDGSDGLIGVSGAAPAGPYDAWATSGVVTGVTFDGDANGDGIEDGIAFLLGAATPDDKATSLLPTSGEDGSGGLELRFTMLKPGNSAPAVLSLVHSGDLGITDPWSGPVVIPASTGTSDGVSFTVTENAGDPTKNDVIATIPSAGNSVAGKLFGRLVGEP
ncbi:hypothetical protein HAHE_42340 [Haloferula helveola]|uniref:Fibronectin type-III domain-containing protein n=1 Tax=Haloferula helveola TaxID=490095 RepID=A0ABM7RI92_9BACT|nr:hypothetical protein HAHE_42340 [Haloferula helveola]